MAAYVLLVGALFTPLIDPLTAGRDDTWALFVCLAAAHLGLGAALRLPWVLAAPVAVAVVAFVAGRGEGFAWLSLIVGVPVLGGLTALGRLAGRRAPAAAAGLLVLAALAPTWAAVEHLRRGPHLPAAAQAALPLELSLANLCPGSETPAPIERDLRRRAEVLLRELGRRPQHLVTYTYHYSDEPAERRAITVRELAEEHLKELGGCVPGLERRLRGAR